MENNRSSLNTNGNQSNTYSSNISCSEMNSSNENIDCNVLQDTRDSSNNIEEWSATTSALCVSNPTDISQTSTEILKECCANPSDTLIDKDDFMVIESSSAGVNITNFNADDTKYFSLRKPTAFQKKHKSYSENVSCVFNDILNDDSQMEVTQNSVCLNRFQKRKRLLPPNDGAFDKISKSDSSGTDSIEISMNSPRFRFSKKKNDKSCFDIPNYSLSSTDTVISNNTSKTKNHAVFKKLLDSSLSINDKSNDIDVSKTKILTPKFTRKNIKVVESAFDNVISELSVMSDTTQHNDISTVNLQEVSKCSTILNMSNLNHTYNVPLNYNSSQLGSSKSVKNNSGLKNISIELPTNETYTINDDLTLNKSELKKPFNLVNSKNTLSNTYTIENSVNENLSRSDSGLNSANRTANTLADLSNIHNQLNKSSVQKPNFIRKLHLDEVSQHFTIANDDGDLTFDEFNKTGNNVLTRFKSKKVYNEGDSQMFDNIINNSSQDNEMSTFENTHCSKNNTICSLNSSAKLANNDLFNISSKTKLNLNESIDKSLTRQTVSLDTVFENNKSVLENPLLLQYNISNNAQRKSGKFNFGRSFHSHSLSYQRNRKSFEGIKQCSVSLNIIQDKIPKEKSKILCKSANDNNVDVRSHSEICTISENNLSLQILQNSTFSPSSMLNITKHRAEQNCHESMLSQNTTYKLSQTLEPHFTGAHNTNVHSGVFSGLIDDSLNNNASLNVTKQPKFKKYKNISGANSVMFENVINNTQESNSTLTQEKTLNPSVLSDQSKIQSYEISMFANTDELWSNRKVPKSFNNSLKKISAGKTLNFEETSDSTKHSTIKYPEENVSTMSVDNKTFCEQNNETLTSNTSRYDCSLSGTTEVLEDYNLPNTNFEETNNSIKHSTTKYPEGNVSTMSVDNKTFCEQNNESLTSKTSRYNCSLSGTTELLENYNSPNTNFEETNNSIKHSITKYPEGNVSTMSVDKTFGEQNNETLTSKTSRYNCSLSGTTEVLENYNSPNTNFEETNNSIKHSSTKYSKGHVSTMSVNKTICVQNNKQLTSKTSGYDCSLSSTTEVLENHNSSNISQIRSNKTLDQENNSIELDNTANINLAPEINDNDAILASNTCLSRTSRNILDFSNENIENETDDSIFWTTLSENSTSRSNVQNNSSRNKFQTPKNKNKLAIAQRIANTIGILSENKQKSIHPGAFELEENLNRPLTRSLVLNSSVRSPSLLTRVFAANNTLDESVSFLQSLSNTIVDEPQIEETVTKKFKSLYNKESWITKRLYNFMVGKLQQKYHIYAVQYAEKFIKYFASILKQVYNDKVDLQLYSNMLKYHMARYGIINNTFEYIGFLTDYIPRPYYDKLMPGWDIETSEVKFDPLKYYIPIMEDEEFLNEVMEDLNK